VSCTNILQNFKGLWFGLRRRNGTLWVSKVSSCVCWSRRFNEGKPAPSTFSRMKRNPIILYWSYQLLKSLNPKSLPPLHFWNWPFGKWNVITSGFFEVLPPPLSHTHTTHTNTGTQYSICLHELLKSLTHKSQPPNFTHVKWPIWKMK
jgi:hypothetical protein